MKPARRLLNILADGQYHSGEELGHLLGMTRGGVWKAIKQCSDYGLEIISTHGKGYQLPGGLELLAHDQIIAELSIANKSLLPFLEIFDALDSTNLYLLEKARQSGHSGQICIVEQQTAGRGRRGRAWITPFASQIALSLLWQFSNGTRAIEGLSIAVGVAIVRALERYGITELSLKWPNDILWEKRKLAGILIEMFVDSLGVCHAIIGVGINLNLHEISSQQLDQPWVDLAQIINKRPERNKIAGLVIDELLTMLPVFQQRGLTVFQQEWQALDALYHTEITVHTLNETYQGMAQGIDDMGGLIVDVNGTIRTFHAAEVSVRPNS